MKSPTKAPATVPEAALAVEQARGGTSKALLDHLIGPRLPANFTPEESVVADLIESNRRDGMAVDAALLGLGGLTESTFAARWPDSDIPDDAEFSRRVELLSAEPAMQRVAAEMQARRNVNAALEILGRQLADPECSTTTAKDIAELSMKRAAQMGTDPEYRRTLRLECGAARVSTPFGRISTPAADDPAAFTLSVLKRMGCKNQAEVDAVLDILRNGGGVALAGW